MPRYFFDIADHDIDVDDEGVELADAAAARTAAIVFAGDYLRNDPQLVWDGNRLQVNVRDEAGAMLLSIAIRATPPDHADFGAAA